MFKTKYHLKAVIFDMDGVITNTMPDHFKAWAKVLHEAGIVVTRMDIYKREGQPGFQSLKEIFADHQHPFDEPLAWRILRRKEEFFQKTSHVRFIIGARTFLKNLYRSGFRLALVTGTASKELSGILPKQLRELFEVVVTGSDVEFGKPHPEPYLRALDALKIMTGDAIVIENAPFGIRSAKAAGLSCVALMTSLSQEYLAEADHVFKSYRQLMDGLCFELKG